MSNQPSLSISGSTVELEEIGTAKILFGRIPPRWLLIFAAILSVPCVLVTILWATHLPWYGMQLAPHPNGIQVVAVVAQGPSDGLLAPGDVLSALRLDEGKRLPLVGDSLLREHQLYPTFAQANHFVERQEKLFAAVSNGSATFVLADGREVRVGTFERRPIGDLPLGFWAMAGASMFVLLVGVGIWAYSRGTVSTRLVALSSVAYLLAGLCLAIYGTREWLLDPALFSLLTATNSIGNMVAAFSLVVLLWYYPRPLGNFPMASVVLPIAALVWVNNQFLQWVELPLHAYRMSCFISVALAAWLAYLQWNATRQRPLERAALLWFLLSLAVGIGLLLANYMLSLLHTTPKLGFWACQIRILPLYVGLMLGVLQYRLFDLDRWWFSVWVWFFAGFLVVLFDLGLVYYAQLNLIGAMTLSLLIAGWVYFPLRQWAWSRFVHSPSEQLEAHLPQLLDTFFSASDGRRWGERWRSLLMHVFEPLSVRVVTGQTGGVRLKENGFVLAVPDVEPENQLLLSGRSHGNRLFNREDARLASFILTLARKSAGIREAQERGATLERERIARDLHDDVAPQLLTLAHTAESRENAGRARAALQTLRESIYALSDPRKSPLETVLAEWRVEVADRLEAAGVRLSWQQPEQLPELALSSRQRLNLSRVLREALSNALRHGHPVLLSVVIALTDGRLTLRLSHDGYVAPPETWRPGKGISNMRSRVAEFGGEIEWHLAQPGSHLVVSWDVPLVALDALAVTST